MHLLPFLESKKMNQIIDYVGVEAYPISADELLSMNYVKELDAVEYQAIFEQMHQSNWEEKTVLDDDFSTNKTSTVFC